MTTMTVMQALSAKFTKSQTRFRMNVVHKEGNLAQAVPFVPTSVVEDRLDDVLGAFGWSALYTEIESSNPSRMLGVRCMLTLVDPESGKSASREGFSTFTEFSDMAMKATYADAFRVAASKFGVGRYLYQVPLKAQLFEVVDGRRVWKEEPVLPEGFYATSSDGAGVPEEASHEEGADTESVAAPEVQTEKETAASQPAAAPVTPATPAAETAPKEEAAPAPAPASSQPSDIPGLDTTGMPEETVSAVKDILGKIPNVSPSTIRNYLNSKKAMARFSVETLNFLREKVDAQEALAKAEA